MTQIRVNIQTSVYKLVLFMFFMPALQQFTELFRSRLDKR